MRPLRSASIAALRFCGVTPALAQDLAGLVVLLDREREQQPLDGDEAVARLLAGLLGGVEHARERRLEIELPGPAAFDLRDAWRAPPRPRSAPRASARRSGRSGPPPSPSGSSSSTFSRCSGANCWWPSRRASDCADCTKPRARSVYFSMFILYLPRPVPAAPKARPDHRHWVFPAASMIASRGLPGPSGARPHRCMGTITAP